MMTGEFRRAKLVINSQFLIIEHFDSIVNEFDIYVENLLERCQNVKNTGKIKRAVATRSHRVNQMNQARFQLIDDIRQVEDTVIKYCVENQDVLKRKLKSQVFSSSTSQILEIKREVFSKTCVCFLVFLNREELRSNIFVDHPLNVFLVIVERIFLDDSDIRFIRDRIHKRDATDWQCLDEQFIRRHMVLNAIESKLKSGFQSNVMSVKIEPISEVHELVLANQKINNIDLSTCEAKFGNLKYLDLRKNKLERLDAITLQNMSQIETLFLSSNMLDLNKDTNAFESLAELRSLHLDLNRVRHLGARVFANNAQLEKLSLMHVYLTEIDENSFATLSNLRDLELSANSLQHFSPQVFRNTTSLRYLRLHSNRLERLDDLTFSSCSSLEILSLSSNLLVSLAPQCFVGLVALVELNLSENRLDRVEPEWFESLSCLKSLDLSSNMISSLQPGVFLQLKSLESLKLFKNGLQVLEEGVFQGLVQLERLVLRENKLTSLNSSVFEGLVALKLVDMCGNQLLSKETLLNLRRSINENVKIITNDQN